MKTQKPSPSLQRFTLGNSMMEYALPIGIFLAVSTVIITSGNFSEAFLQAFITTTNSSGIRQADNSVQVSALGSFPLLSNIGPPPEGEQQVCLLDKNACMNVQEVDPARSETTGAYGSGSLDKNSYLIEQLPALSKKEGATKATVETLSSLASQGHALAKTLKTLEDKCPPGTTCKDSSVLKALKKLQEVKLPKFMNTWNTLKAKGDISDWILEVVQAEVNKIDSIVTSLNIQTQQGATSAQSIISQQQNDLQDLDMKAAIYCLQSGTNACGIMNDKRLEIMISTMFSNPSTAEQLNKLYGSYLWTEKDTEAFGKILSSNSLTQKSFQLPDAVFNKMIETGFLARLVHVYDNAKTKGILSGRINGEIVALPDALHTDQGKGASANSTFMVNSLLNGDIDQLVAIHTSSNTICENSATTSQTQQTTCMMRQGANSDWEQVTAVVSGNVNKVSNRAYK